MAIPLPVNALRELISRGWSGTDFAIVAAVIVQLTDWDTGTFDALMRDVAKVSRKSRETIRRVLLRAEAEGLLHREPRYVPEAKGADNTEKAERRARCGGGEGFRFRWLPPIAVVASTDSNTRPKSPIPTHVGAAQVANVAAVVPIRVYDDGRECARAEGDVERRALAQYVCDAWNRVRRSCSRKGYADLPRYSVDRIPLEAWDRIMSAAADAGPRMGGVELDPALEQLFVEWLSRDGDQYFLAKVKHDLRYLVSGPRAELDDVVAAAIGHERKRVERAACSPLLAAGPVPARVAGAGGVLAALNRRSAWRRSTC